MRSCDSVGQPGVSWSRLTRPGCLCFMVLFLRPVGWPWQVPVIVVAKVWESKTLCTSILEAFGHITHNNIPWAEAAMVKCNVRPWTWKGYDARRGEELEQITSHAEKRYSRKPGKPRIWPHFATCQLRDLGKVSLNHCFLIHTIGLWPRLGNLIEWSLNGSYH